MEAVLGIMATMLASPSSQPTVLVVEDEPGIADVLLAYLRRDGMQAELATSGEVALELFRRPRAPG